MIKLSTDKLYALAVANNMCRLRSTNMVNRVGGYRREPARRNSRPQRHYCRRDRVSIGQRRCPDLCASSAVNADKDNIDFNFTVTPSGSNPLPVEVTPTLALPKVNDAATGGYTGSRRPRPAF